MDFEDKLNLITTYFSTEFMISFQTARDIILTLNLEEQLFERYNTDFEKPMEDTKIYVTDFKIEE